MDTHDEVREALKTHKLSAIAEITNEKHDKLWRFREGKMKNPTFDFVMKVKNAIEKN